MYITLSYLIDENTPMYGGRPGFISKIKSSIKNGDSANISFWQFPNHLGTHIDFPYHFYENGQSIQDFDLDFFIYNGKDIQLFEVMLIGKELLIKEEHIKKEEINKKAKIVLLKTNVSEYRNNEKYWKYNPGISLELAEWLRQNFHELKIIGLDSISISSWQHRKIGRMAHRNLLNPEKPILLIEDMDLSQVNQKTQFKKLIIAPFRASHENGCPCTIFAEVK